MKADKPAPPAEALGTASDSAKIEAGRVWLKPAASSPSLPPENTVVLTDLGPAGRINGHWFKWWTEMKCFGRKAMTATPSWWQPLDTDARPKRLTTTHITGLGSTAWRVIEPDAPGLVAFVYDGSCMAVSLAPETDELTFAIINEGTNETLGLVVVSGRPGLNSWYLSHVGHEPDKEPGGQVPIMNLIDNVASHLLLRYFEQGGDPA